MMLKAILVLAIATGLASCTDTSRRYEIQAAPSAVKVRARVSSILVRTVSLPTYASAEEIAYQDPSGAIKINKSDLWADEPERATTLVISRHLNVMTAATVAPQPWPLEESPQAMVDIRVEQLLATDRNTLRLAGQYFIGGQEIEQDLGEDGEPKPPRRTIRSISRLFDIEVPLQDADIGTLAGAHSNALRILAEKIARDFAR